MNINAVNDQYIIAIPKNVDCIKSLKSESQMIFATSLNPTYKNMLIIAPKDECEFFQYLGTLYIKLYIASIVATTKIDLNNAQLPNSLNKIDLCKGIVAYTVKKPDSIIELSMALDNDQERGFVLKSNSNTIFSGETFIHPWVDYFGIEYPLLIDSKRIYFAKDSHIAAIIEEK